MLTDGRKHLEISFNLLNLPTAVKQGGMVLSTYVYLADGTKAAVYTGDNTSTGSGYSYLGSLRYTKSGTGNSLESTPFGGGEFVNNSGSIQPYYHITDHLGSVRVIANSSGVVQEQNDYYPYGGRHTSGNSYAALSGNNYKFNGKEEQTISNLGYLDYGARMYDNVIGRWMVQDQLAEKYISTSPYNYCLGNPVKFVDPDGRKVNLSLMTDKSHKAALVIFVQTKEGLAFIGRYMAKGESLQIGGKNYSFNQTGDRAKDVLWISSRQFEDKNTLGLNRTMTPNGYPINSAIGSDRIEQRGVMQVIDLAKGMDEKQSTMTLGHEAFVHADESADMLTDVENGNLRGETSMIKAIQNTGNKANSDHKRLGEVGVPKYKNFALELSQKFNDLYYKKEYEGDVKKYK